MPLSIVEQDGRLAVGTPYHPNFPARARMLGGEWDAARRVWMFDAGDEPRVRRLCQEIYGADGSEGAAAFPEPSGHRRNQFADAGTAPHYFGHRERLRERLLAAGTESLADYELLEVILFAARPRGDVKPVAKALIEYFGGLAKTMSAEPEELASAGLNRAGIAAIKAARQAALRLMH